MEILIAHIAFSGLAASGAVLFIIWAEKAMRDGF